MHTCLNDQIAVHTAVNKIASHGGAYIQYILQKGNVPCPFDNYRYGRAMCTGTGIASAILSGQSQSKMVVFVQRDDLEH